MSWRFWSKENTQPLPESSETGTKVIVGLGNPGEKYQKTRHNLGFMVTSALASELDAAPARNRFKASIREAKDGNQKIVLVQPQTFMNMSGVAVQQVKNWYRLGNEDLLVIFDDADLPFGTFRLRESGSAGGHNGLSSVLQHLGSGQVPRLRVGIGRSNASTIGHVLSKFSADEAKQLPNVIEGAKDAALLWSRRGPTIAMNVVNASSASEPGSDQPAEFNHKPFADSEERAK